MNSKRLIVTFCFSLLFTLSKSQTFLSKEILYTKSDALSGWYTENQYTTVGTHGSDIYFILLDNTRRPYVGKITKTGATTEPLEKIESSYRALDDGHQEFSIGIDKQGYIHVTGDMHNFPQANASHIPSSLKSGNIMYWKSKNPGDITEFTFMGNTPSQTIPGSAWSYGRFVTDRNDDLYFISRTLARQYYYQNGGRGLGIYRYNTSTKTWTALGVKAPISDATFPVVAWQESGQDAGSYQQFKGDISFDTDNNLHLTTGMNTENGPAQVNSVVYAFSNDGGASFKKANGSTITLPMEIKSGSRQGDVIDSEPLSTFEQPSVTYAFGNKPVVHYTASGSSYYKYWTGTAWSSKLSSPADYRGKLLFNDFTQELYFIQTSTGNFYTKTSFTSTHTTYDTGETFRAFDIKSFRKMNIIYGISWKSTTGKYEVVKLIGDTTINTVKFDCAGIANGKATIDNCGICSGGNTSVSACTGSIQAEEVCENTGIFENVNTGFKGTGYFNSNNNVNSFGSWSLNASSAINLQLTIRYANAGTSNRPAKLYINNTLVNSLINFAPTGDWKNWSTVTISLPLQAGINTFKLSAEETEGLVNLDQFSFSSSKVSNQACVISATENKIGKDESIFIYPNPSSSNFNISIESAWELYTSNGTFVKKGFGNAIQSNDLNSGLYIAIINGENFKLVKE